MDKLDLSLYVRWRSEAFMEKLAEAKTRARLVEEPEPIVLGDADAGAMIFGVKPYGVQGHEWVMENVDLTATIGNWIEPIQRPSMSVSIRAEALWRDGVRGAFDRVLRMVRLLGGEVELVKVSRVDPCVDMLIREDEWYRDLKDRFVTRARKLGTYEEGPILTGFSIGSGSIAARLYDKPVEIARKSAKWWMFDIWGIEGVPDQHRVIRVEFQCRRECIKALGIDTLEELLEQAPGVWAYCTQKWFRLVEDASLHHTQQHVLPWWSVVTDGFPNAQDAQPLVRQRAMRGDLELNARQAIGNLAAIIAVLLPRPLGREETLPAGLAMRRALDEACRLVNLCDTGLAERVRKKQAQKWRGDASAAGALGHSGVGWTQPDSEA